MYLKQRIRDNIIISEKVIKAIEIIIKDLETKGPDFHQFVEGFEGLKRSNGKNSRCFLDLGWDAENNKPYFGLQINDPLEDRKLGWKTLHSEAPVAAFLLIKNEIKAKFIPPFEMWLASL